MFGSSILMDHPYIEFDTPKGNKLHLPCGTIATALEEESFMQEDTSSKYVTTIIIAVPSQCLSWKVSHRATEVQEMLRAGLMKLNRESEGPAPLPFRPS
jgi:hypothetical protein